MSFPKKKKDIPDDVVLVLCSIIVGLYWLWTMQSSIYTVLDFWIYLFAFMGMIVPPMLWSSYCKYKEKN